MKKLLLPVLLCSAAVVFASPKLPQVFGDNMVLQRDMAINVWGWADPREKITVRFHDQSATAITGKDGRWMAQLKPETAGGPYQLEIKGKTTLSFKNILVGDVWVCSGQSNMEWPVQLANNAAAEIAGSANDQIRHFTLVKAVSGKPLDDVQAAPWQAADPAHTGSFTAVGYFFARELQQQLHIPIGLIHTSWGGTDIETWISREGFQNSPEFANDIGKLPVLNLDSMALQQSKKTDDLLQKIQGSIPSAATVAGFSAAGFDDSGWPTMTVPGLWEAQQLKDFDGVVWLRKTLTLDEASAAAATELLLGKVDDLDETWINGTKLGSTNGYNVDRRYAIPKGLLKAGKNSLVVRVEDTGGGGGIYSEASEIGIVAGDKKIPIDGQWAFQVEKAMAGMRNVGPNTYPSLLYNAMIHPILNMRIKGAIWYQGESNAGRAVQYEKAFPLMINDWRTHWKEGDFPFYFVQLSSFIAGDGNSAKGSTWAELREAQTMTRALANTGMAVTIDIGERNDIHPRNKQDVGKRLAAVALKNTYGKSLVASGPVFQRMNVTGNTVELFFQPVQSALTTTAKDGMVQGFEVAGEDQRFYPAKATIENNRVKLVADQVTRIVAVRYAWADDAGAANLFNAAGFPAEPFRTDNWKSSTEGVRYSK